MKFAFLIPFILFIACTQPHKNHAGNPVPYGTIYSKNTWQNITDFTTNGAKVYLSSDKIVVAHESATSTLDLNYGTLLDHWKATAKIKDISSDAIAGIGTRSINGYQSFNVYAAVDFSTGCLNIYSTNKDVITKVAASTDSLFINPKDGVIISLERKVDTVYASAINFTRPSGLITAKYAYLTDDYSVPSPNTGTFSIFADKGTFTFDSLSIKSNEIKNANILIVTDSKGMYVADSFTSRWPQQISNHFKPAVLSVGGTDGVNELLARVPEIIALSPDKVLLAIGRNDINFKMNADTLKQKYSRAVRQIELAGITVFHLNCIYEPSLNQQRFSQWISSTYGENVIDTYGPTRKAKGILYKDGVHPNQAGNNLIASIILRSGKLK